MTPTYFVILALLNCLNGGTQVQCSAAVAAARHNPDLSYLVTMIEENA